MSTQQDIYAASSENHPPMLNKENYVPWSSRLLRYAKSRPNGKLIYNSIINGPYMIELTNKNLTWLKAEVQAFRTILLGLPEASMRKRLKLFNEQEKFTSTDGESIESYYHLQNPGIQNVGNQNGLIVVLRIANQNPNRDGMYVAARELHSQNTEKGCCLSSNSATDCSKGRSRDPTDILTESNKLSKALDEGSLARTYVRKFLMLIHLNGELKGHGRFEDLKDLSSLALGELIDNLKVHEVVMEKDSEIYKGKKERVNSIALKANKCEHHGNKIERSG
ncbi:hypothetical protein Tco_0294568 [Tanacetum coccineum]